MRRELLVATLLCAGCPDRSISALPPVQTGVETKGIPVEADLDILFVIDNSASTGDKQALFAQNFQNYVQALDSFPGGRPNLHIGVVSTTVGTGGSTNISANCPITAPGDDGALHSALVGGTVNGTACSSCTVSGSFLSDLAASPTTRTTNYSCPSANPLATALPCIAELGVNGCGFEAPLEAMKRALDGSNPANAGFVRDGAFLAIVILTDEDDCSVKDPSLFALNNVGPGDFRCQPLYAYDCAQPISATTPGTYTNCKPKVGGYLQDTSAYVDFLASIKQPGQITVAVIGGVDANGNPPDPNGFTISTGPLTIPGTPMPQALALEPQCMTTINLNPAIARPGLRLSDFVQRTTTRGTHAKYYSVCQSDYSPALADLGKELATLLSPCLQGLIDTTDSNLANPGLQPQCTVSDVQHYGAPDASESLVSPCHMLDATTPDPAGARPCWWVAADPVACPDPVATPSHLVLHVERATPAPIGTTQVVSCVVDTP
jgi:hypothetical protein